MNLNFNMVTKYIKYVYIVYNCLQYVYMCVLVLYFVVV